MDVVPEGRWCKEGDTVVELDSSSLQLEENSQKIQVSTRESQLAQAQNSLKAAEIAKTEYLDGSVRFARETDGGCDCSSPSKAWRRPNNQLNSAKSLKDKEHCHGACKSKRPNSTSTMPSSNSTMAQTNLETLRKLTKQKELTVLDANIASAEAHGEGQATGAATRARQAEGHSGPDRQMHDPGTAAGQVVYANETDMFRGSSSSQFIVTPGAMVRERQVIIRLPNANDMQVKATVNEARVTLVRPGLPRFDSRRCPQG